MISDVQCSFILHFFNQRRLTFLLLFLSLCAFTGCYLLKGYSIAPEVQTYFVGNFKLTALNAPGTITQTFAESLKDKISKESRLKYTETNPHLEFNGSIQAFNVSSVAPQPGETTAFNRLTISVMVEYTNHLNPKDQWTKSFSHFEDFPSETDLLQVQDDLINIIFKQILEDIFNQAFNNW
ncbi:MAG: LPS assembly lipoprotein LptE [Saprospiraceae bacterium]